MRPFRKEQMNWLKNCKNPEDIFLRNVVHSILNNENYMYSYHVRNLSITYTKFSNPYRL